MPEYRRVQLKGGIYFITVVTFERQPAFRNSIARQILRNARLDVARRFPFSTIAVCLLPDHIHTLIQCPETDADYPMRIREIKRLFTAGYKQQFGLRPASDASRRGKHEAVVWQRRYWEHTIRDENDLHAHLDYFHYNPVKHGLVENVRDWEWSSFHRYVRMGYYNEDWGSEIGGKDLKGDFGE